MASTWFVVHGFCPNCAKFVLSFVLAIRLFRTLDTNSQPIPCNSRTILLIAGTSLAFLVTHTVTRWLLPILCNLECLVFFARGCLHLRLVTRFGPSQPVGGSPVFYGPAQLPAAAILPALCFRCPLSAVNPARCLPILGCLALRLAAVYRCGCARRIGTPHWRDGTARTSLPACVPVRH